MDRIKTNIKCIWEIEQLKKSFHSKVIFITSYKKVDVARQIVNRFFPNKTDYLFEYIEDGNFVKEEEFYKIIDRWFID